VERIRPTLFAVFFLSGFCSLLYQIVWLRLAFANFGMITPVLSVVLSVFMLGLGIGSAFGGSWAQTWRRHLKASPAYAYGVAEFSIGIGAFVVPLLFAAGEDFLLRAGEASSALYLLVSALFIIVGILPWCIMMGATFPLMMAFIREIDPIDASSFGFLYVANVMGAMAGTVLTALALICDYCKAIRSTGRSTRTSPSRRPSRRLMRPTTSPAMASTSGIESHQACGSWDC
jgi:MFS family permease